MKRIAKLVCLIVVVVAFAGCPTQFRLGVWVLFISNVGAAAIDLNPNGTGTQPSELPSQADSYLLGVVTWERNGSSVTINQVLDGGFSNQYIGELQSPTEMTGTWQQTAGGNSAGLFTAQRVAN